MVTALGGNSGPFTAQPELVHTRLAHMRPGLHCLRGCWQHQRLTCQFLGDDVIDRAENWLGLRGRLCASRPGARKHITAEENDQLDT